jgi:hypothetical protein
MKLHKFVIAAAAFAVTGTAFGGTPLDTAREDLYRQDWMWKGVQKAEADYKRQQPKITMGFPTDGKPRVTMGFPTNGRPVTSETSLASR